VNDVPAGYYDGVIAARRQVLLALEGDTLRLAGDGLDQRYAIAELVVTPGVGSIHRVIRLPDGGICEVEDGSLATAVERMQGKGRSAAFLRRWEKSLPLAAAALVLTIVMIVLTMRFGLPALARHVAFALPPEAEAALGSKTLATLDRFMLKPSRLSPERRGELAALLRRVTGEGAQSRYRLEVRAGQGLGANALALPSGIVLLTDELVEMARNDDEIAALLAHEVGHVRGRHALRQVLQNSTAGLLIASLTGDLLSVTSLSAALPTALVDASFSREFEREADDAALAWMDSVGVPRRTYAEMLGRLQAQLDVRSGQAHAGSNPARNYLSTHPDTGERIRRILYGSKQDGNR
jgi:Zn-dependent protease with chaperone function